MTNFANEPVIADAWYIAGWSHELSDGPVARRIMDEDVVLFRTVNGKAGALEDRCCHRGVRLSLGESTDSGIRCGYHGMAFGPSGECIDNPGEKLNRSFFVRSFPLVERQNFLWIWMGEPANANEDLIIDFPYHDQWSFHFGHYPIEANFMFLIDNLMDLTHLGYVHGSTIGGDIENQNVAEVETWKTEQGARFVRWMEDVPPPPTFVASGGFQGNIDRRAEFEYIAPASVMQSTGVFDAGKGSKESIDLDGGLKFRLFHHATPASESEFHYFFSAGVEGAALDSPESQKFFQDVLDAFLEDKLFIEAQQDAVIRNPSERLLLREHDKAVAFARQAVAQLRRQNFATAAE